MRKASYYEIVGEFDDDENVGLLIEVVVEVGLVERIEMVKFLCLYWLVTWEKRCDFTHEPLPALAVLDNV